MTSACCAPDRGGSEQGQHSGSRSADAGSAPANGVPVGADQVVPRRPQERPRVQLPGGGFQMGGQDIGANPLDGEGPIRTVTLSPFAIDTEHVTTADFAQFVQQTGYVTEAEEFGWSFVFAGFLSADVRKASPRVQQTPWWCAVDGATWAAPEGPGSTAAGRERHPVVHVSWRDGQAYADWAGGALPTEAQWEYAARGGLHGARYPWGDELMPGGEHRCNIWQGRFPVKNTAEDGFRGTCPVDAFAPNGYGLYGVAGNVWDMCADVWTAEHSPAAEHDPTGPAGSAEGASRVMRGGSYLCHDSYCNRYRVAARTQNTPDSASGNQGFRLVYPAG